MSLHIFYTFGAAALLAVIAYTINSARLSRKYKLPPFVEGRVPLFGNALQLPPVGHEAGVVVKEWAEKYGEMCGPLLGVCLTCAGFQLNSAGALGCF
jgi:hypothetical protein